MNELDRVYAAGFFDGEGSVSLLQRTKRKDGKAFWCLATQVTGKNKLVIEWLRNTFGGSVYVVRRKDKSEIYHKWMLMSHKAKEFLILVLPYLKLKTPQAKIGIDFQQTTLPKIGSRGLRTNELYEAQKTKVEQIKEYNRND